MDDIYQLAISSALGFFVGLGVSLVFWFIFYRILVPKIGFSNSILKREGKDSSGNDYRVRFKNLGRRSVISLECIARFIIDWEGNGTWAVIYIPMNLEGHRKTELPKIAPAKNAPGYGGTRTMFLYPNVVSEFSTSPRYPENFRKKAMEGTLGLEDLFQLGADAELKIYVTGYDEFSGARKMFESKYYKLSDIAWGDFKNQGLEVELATTTMESSQVNNTQQVLPELRCRGAQKICGEKMEDKDLYKIAIETRNMEIGLFWQRSNYFLVLNTAIAVGFFSVTRPPYQIVLSLFGVFISILWFRVNLGSKYWQSRWETRASKLEQKLGSGINMFSTTKEVTDADVKESLLNHKKEEDLSFYDRLVLNKPSVSKIMIGLSASFIILWGVIFVVAIYEFKLPTQAY